MAAQSPLSAQAALELFKGSYQVMDTVGSFRSHMDIDGSVEGEDVTISMDFVLSQQDMMHSTLVVDTPDGKQSIESVIARPYVYIKIPGEGWLRMDLEALAGLSGQSEQGFSDPRGFSNSFFPTENIPWELYKVSSMGRDRIDGVPVEHLSIQFDFQEVWSQLDSEPRGLFGQSFGVGGLDVQEFVQQIEIKPLEFWVDAQGYNRRFAMDMLMGDDMSLTIDMWMFDFNKDVVIDVPQDYTDVSP